MPRMTSVSKHVYAGVELAEGDDFEAESQHVEFLKLSGRAVPKAAAYNTRHMVAATQEEEAPAPVAERRPRFHRGNTLVNKSNA